MTRVGNSSRFWWLISLCACSSGTPAADKPAPGAESSAPIDDTGVAAADDTAATDDTSVAAHDDTAATDDTSVAAHDDTGNPDSPPDTDQRLQVADFTLVDLNVGSSRFDEEVSPRDYLERASGWYFVHST